MRVQPEAARDPHDRLIRAVEHQAELDQRLPVALVVRILEHEIDVAFDEQRTAAPTYVKGLVMEYLATGEVGADDH